MAEIPVLSHLQMDRAEPIGNSLDPSGRRALHVIDMASDWIDDAVGNYIKFNYPDSVTEIIQFKNAADVLNREWTLVYTDATKEDLDTVTLTAKA